MILDFDFQNGFDPPNIGLYEANLPPKFGDWGQDFEGKPPKFGASGAALGNFSLVHEILLCRNVIKIVFRSFGSFPNNPRESSRKRVFRKKTGKEIFCPLSTKYHAIFP